MLMDRVFSLRKDSQLRSQGDASSLASTPCGCEACMDAGMISLPVRVATLFRQGNQPSDHHDAARTQQAVPSASVISQNRGRLLSSRGDTE